MIGPPGVRWFGPGLAALLTLGAACSAAAAAECPPDDAGVPRTLVLALDGVPFRSIERARAEGAFAGWPEARSLVSTFPSVTNVAFTAIFRPFGVERADGYEVQHFDRERNAIVGGTPFGYRRRLYAWRDVFDRTSRSLGGKLKVYTAPKRSAWHEVDEAERLVFEGAERVILAHVGATDALMHLRGDEAIHRFLMKLDRRVDRMRREHVHVFGDLLRLVLLSDHGNSSTKIRRARGLRRTLRRAGLHVGKHLRGPGDVVAPTFGLVGYGALFLRPRDAATAGRAIATHEDVELAAWLERPGEIRVVAGTGEAVVRWRDRPGGRRLAYLPVDGDPLRLEGTLGRLDETGALDPAGFADAEEWLRAGAEDHFPDAASRLVRALSGRYVDNRATVIFSLREGYAWGWTSAHLTSHLVGGKLEGTHGALDRSSTLGFFLASDPALQPLHPVRAESALEGLAARAACHVASAPEAPDAGGAGM